MEWLSQMAPSLWASHGPRAIAVVLTLVLGWLAVKIVTRVVRGAMTRAKVDVTLTGFLGNVTYIGLITLVVISALGQLNVPTTSFVAVIGAAGLAVGFALQGSLGNFASGVLLIIFRPFHVGDYIEAAGIGGVVEDVHVFATKLRTPDNKAVIVPNSAITGGNITNYTAKETRRVDLVFGIGYGDDIRKAKEILESILRNDVRVLKDPEPTVAVLELGESSVNLAVRPWVKKEEYWNVLFDVTERVKLEFDAQGISIPFPQRDVHLIQAA